MSALARASNIRIGEIMLVYLPWTGERISVSTIGQAIHAVHEIMFHEGDPTWRGILNELHHVATPAQAARARDVLRREFLLRGMTLPEDVLTLRPADWTPRRLDSSRRKRRGASWRRLLDRLPFGRGRRPRAGR